jgi:hypothetical protein
MVAQLGAMLKEMEKHSGGNPVPKKNRVDSDDEPPTLEELGIDKNTSMAGSKLAPPMERPPTTGGST